MAPSIHILLLSIGKHLKAFLIKKAREILLLFFSLIFGLYYAQVNYIQNPSFEILDSCNSINFIYPPKYWDTLKAGGGGGPECFSPCNVSQISRTPSNGYRPSYQVPKTGSNYALYTFYTANSGREYIQNKLKQTLSFGKTYCVRFWVSLMNESLYSIDEIGAYLDNGSIYTTYYGISTLTPQIKSTFGLQIIDTLKWVKIEGVFTANGSEEYMTIGNFKTDASTSASVMPAPAWPNNTQRSVADYYVDDVSVIDVSTPAYAGPDRYCIPGDSVYIGRPSEVGLDDDCFWYQLPNTTIPVDTSAGIYVKPAITTTYVVKQDICGYIKSDTVVVYKSGVGLKEISLASRNSILYPNPNNGSFTIKLSGGLGNQSVEISILDLTGRTIFNENKIVNGNEINMNNNLLNGSYILRVKLQDGKFDTHSLIISR